jgi:hypothetical protein
LRMSNRRQPGSLAATAPFSLIAAKKLSRLAGDQSRLGQSWKGDLSDPVRVDGCQAAIEVVGWLPPPLVALLRLLQIGQGDKFRFSEALKCVY